jgi:uncharacterized membrane protein (UPF0127 family)
MRPRIPAAIFAAMLALGALGAKPAPPAAHTIAIEAPDRSVRAQIKVEIADTPSARERGLMFRDHMDENAGMLFVFPSAQPLSFWMKNTHIALDMMFANPAGEIRWIVSNAQPMSEKLIGPYQDTMYVIEVNSGFAQRHGITTGDRIDFRDFSPKASH